MKAITLTQPWASLVAIGAKKIETRSWPTKYRGPIAIHAAKTFPSSAKDLAQNLRSFRNALGWPNPAGGQLTQEWLNDIAARLKSLPLGMVIATAQLVDCKRTEEILSDGVFHASDEFVFGSYDPGRYGFFLDKVVPVSPVAARGALGLWAWNGDA